MIKVNIGVKKNKENSRHVFLNSNKKYLFDCNECNHEFYVSPAHISSDNNWCSYCCGNFLLCDNNNCTFCFNRSFASSNKIEYFMKKNNIEPRKLFINSNKNIGLNALIIMNLNRHYIMLIKGFGVLIVYIKTRKNVD